MSARLITGSRRSWRVLIVEDHDDLRSLLAQHFENVGYHADTARDGNEAIARALQVRPDVIILDLVMPGLDGWDTARLLRSYPATSAIPLVACTGGSEEEVGRAEASGCDVVMKKPCLPEALETVVNGLLGASDLTPGGVLG